MAITELGLTCLPCLDVLEDPVCSFALIQPGVPAVPHQLTPLHPLLHQEALEGIVAQDSELLQTQQTCENMRHFSYSFSPYSSNRTLYIKDRAQFLFSVTD